jgi:hypothetical protein
MARHRVPPSGHQIVVSSSSSQLTHTADGASVGPDTPDLAPQRRFLRDAK